MSKAKCKSVCAADISLLFVLMFTQKQEEVFVFSSIVRAQIYKNHVFGSLFMTKRCIIRSHWPVLTWHEQKVEQDLTSELSVTFVSL